jgi:hypothetical protein
MEADSSADSTPTTQSPQVLPKNIQKKLINYLGNGGKTFQNRVSYEAIITLPQLIT